MATRSRRRSRSRRAATGTAPPTGSGRRCDIVTPWRSMPVQGGVRVEARGGRDDARGAEREERQQPVDAADVEQRLAGEPDVVRAGAHLVDPAERARHEAAVREHRALRPPGGAGRVTDERGVVLDHVRRLGDAASRRRPAARKPPPPRAPCADRAHPGAGGPATAATAPGVLQDVGDLVRGEPEVHRHRHGAEPVAGEQRSRRTRSRCAAGARRGHRARRRRTRARRRAGRRGRAARRASGPPRRRRARAGPDGRARRAPPPRVRPGGGNARARRPLRPSRGGARALGDRRDDVALDDLQRRRAREVLEDLHGLRPRVLGDALRPRGRPAGRRASAAWRPGG